ncbi:MAG TPA: hypothetical protein VF746_13350 [Longimicrobium sp.]|jgi:uncharacterized protein YukE
MALKSELATLAVRIVGDNDELRRALKRSEGDVRTFAKATSGLRDSFLGNLASDAFQRGAREIIAFGQSAAREFLEAERLGKMLGNAVEGVGQNFARLEPHIDGVVSQLDRMSAFDDEQITEALTRIIEVTGNTETGLRLIGLAVDIAARRGDDLAQTGEKLARAWNGQTRPLREYGVTTKDVNQAFTELRANFAGAAEAELQTTPGRIKEFGNIVSDLKEALAEVVATSPDVRRLFTDVYDGATGAASGVGGLTESLGALLDTIFDLPQVFRNAGWTTNNWGWLGLLTDPHAEDRLDKAFKDRRALNMRQREALSAISRQTSVESLRATMEALRREQAAVSSVAERYGEITDLLGAANQRILALQRPARPGGRPNQPGGGGGGGGGRQRPEEPFADLLKSVRAELEHLKLLEEAGHANRDALRLMWEQAARVNDQVRKLGGEAPANLLRAAVDLRRFVEEEAPRPLAEISLTRGLADDKALHARGGALIGHQQGARDAAKMRAQAEEFRRMREEVEEQMERLGPIIDMAGSHFSDWASDVIENNRKVLKSFREMLTALTADLARFFMNQAVQQFGQMILGAVVGGASPSSTSSRLPAILAPIDGARATGGPVSAGGAYLVGERGPELFLPGSSGNIIPNHRLSRGGGGRPAAGGGVVNVHVTVNQNVQAWDARSVSQMLEGSRDEIAMQVARAINGSGAVRKAIRGN